MIDFRYHLISIVAVFLALATGLVLGASLLNTELINTQNDQNESLIDDKNALREEVADLERQRDALDEFIGATGPLAVRGLLEGQRVVLLTLPGAENGTGQEFLDGLTLDLLEAGAVEVVGTVAINDAWTDQGQVDVLDGLVAQLTQEGIELPDGSAYDRAAVLLANALVAPLGASPTDPVPAPTESAETDPDEPDPEQSEPAQEDSTDPDAGLNGEEITTVLEGLAAGGFVAYDGRPTAVANLAVVVAPPAPEVEDERVDEVNTAWIRLATALDDIGNASVLTGPASAAEAGGVITALRSDATAAGLVSTIDSADDGPGAVATVVTLAAELSGRTGHYGEVGDVDGPIPVLTGPEAG